MPHQPFSSKDDLTKSIWKNTHFGRVVVWCGVNQMIIHLSEASILPSVRSSIHPFLQIILVLNLQCGMALNEFCPPSISLWLLFCLFLLLWLDQTQGRQTISVSLPRKKQKLDQNDKPERLQCSMQKCLRNDIFFLSSYSYICIPQAQGSLLYFFYSTLI